MKEILIDAGGILFNNVLEETQYLHEVSAACGVEIVTLRNELKQRDWIYETGSKSSLDVIREIALDNGANYLLTPTEHLQLYLAHVSKYSWGFKRICALRANPKIRLILANNEARDWDAAKNDVFAHFALFSVLCSSWAMGAVKPHADWLDRLENELGRPRTALLLIDDSEENVRMAKKAGVIAYCVRNEVEFDEVTQREKLCP